MRNRHRRVDDQLPRWLVFAWNVLSVASVDRDDWRVIYSTMLLLSCAYVLYATPQMVCALEKNCDASLSTAIKGMFVRVVASVGLASRLIGLIGNTGRRMAGYRRHVNGYHALEPMSRSEARRLAAFGTRSALVCVLLTVPVNALRLGSMAYHGFRGFVVANVGLVYLQNFSMYCAETHFETLCYALYRKFVAINGHLAALKADVVQRNRYPSAMSSRGRDNHACGGGGRFLAAAADRLLHTAAHMRRLKTKHGLACEAAIDLNHAFGVHLGLSLCSLCLYLMFDVYYHMRGIWDHAKWDVMFYGWITQYVVRFLLITVLAHVTAKQANKSKILITDINNRFLDKDSKEEIQLFLNQICSRTIKFTASDFFTLNIHLITSAIVAGTTYLVILLQFNSSDNNN